MKAVMTAEEITKLKDMVDRVGWLRVREGSVIKVFNNYHGRTICASIPLTTREVDTTILTAITKENAEELRATLLSVIRKEIDTATIELAESGVVV